MSVHLSICPFLEDRGRLSCQIISVCPSVHLSILSREGGRLSCQIISICPSVHMSIIKRQGQSFLSDYFKLSFSPLLKDRGRLSCQIISVCPSVHSFKRGGRLYYQIISNCPSVHLSIIKRQGQSFLSDYFYLSICPFFQRG